MAFLSLFCAAATADEHEQNGAREWKAAIIKYSHVLLMENSSKLRRWLRFLNGSSGEGIWGVWEWEGRKGCKKVGVSASLLL